MARTPLLATMAAVLLIASVPGTAHPGETDATHLCPEVSTLFAHVHGSGDESYFWMDTHEESPHADTGSPYSGDGDDVFVLTLEPALSHAILLNTSDEVRVVVHGLAETSSDVFPGPVQDVFGEVQGVEQVPQPVKDVLADLEDEEVRNVGSGEATIRATLRAGSVVIGTAEATEEVTHSPRPDVERAPFEAQISFAPQVDLIQPSLGNITLTLERLEPLGWDLGTVEPTEAPSDPGPGTVLAATQGPAGQTRVDLPILDHPTGPLCPGWELPPLEASSDAPEKVSREPGQFFEFSVTVTNPERVATNVTVGFAKADSALKGSFHNADAGKKILMDSYSTQVFNARVTIAEGASPGTASINATAMGDNLSFSKRILVTVTEPAPPPPPQEEPPASDDENASAPAEDPSGDNATDLEAEDGGRSPGLAVAASLGALAVAAAFSRRRR